MSGSYASPPHLPQLHDPAVVGPYAYVEPLTETPPVAEEAVQKPHFRPDIEGLRAVAIIAVLLFHIGLPGASGGFVGVDVFYVISGFLITGLLLREGEASGKVDLLRFYARRLRRLLPAALVVIVVTLLASAVILSPLRLTEVGGDAAAAALYVANFRFAIEATDYLSVADPSPLLHYWSLGVEEQFYLVWPAMLLLVARFLSTRILGVFVLVVALASFALSFVWTDTLPQWAFFMLPTRAWELAAGALIAVGLLRIPKRAPIWLAAVLVWAGLALIVLSVVIIGTETPYPGTAAVLPVLGAVFIIVGGVARVTRPGRLLGHPVARFMGRISYSLYLWHWPILVLIPVAIGIDNLVVRIGLAWVAIIIAAISTELIEQPFRGDGLLSKRPRGAVRLGLATSVVVAVGALLVSGVVSVPNPFFKPDPVVLELAAVRNDLPRSYLDGCHLSFADVELRDCAYGDANGTRTAYLFGDSHAEQWLPALDVIARQNGWRLVVHTKAACSPVPVTLWERKLRRVYDECEQWRRAVKKQISKVGPDIVFVGSSREYELWNDGTVDRVVDALPRWEPVLTELLDGLGEAAGRVVLLAETPYLNFDPLDCIAENPIPGACDPSSLLAVDANYAAVEAAAVAASGASIVSLNAILCPGLSCPLAVADTFVFRDKHHLTATYMAQLADPISAYLAGRDPLASPEPEAADS